MTNETGQMDEFDNMMLVEYTSDVVSAYVSNNTVTPADLPALIREVHKAVTEISNASLAASEPELVPAVNPRKSVTREYIVCLEDGKKFKSLKRHLKTHFDMSPEEYREKWGLPSDYPMVAPAYSEKRSALAKEKGLGRKPGKRS